MIKIRIVQSLSATVLLLAFVTFNLRAEDGWTPVKKAGLSFSYPSGWHFQDSGSQPFVRDTCIGHIFAAGSPDGAGTVNIVFFPDFSLMLSEAKIDFRGFMKMYLENFMTTRGVKSLSWEESRARFSHGEADGFLAYEKKGDDVFKAAAVYGDVRGKSAAIVIVTFDICDSVTGVKYINLTEKILAGIAFP